MHVAADTVVAEAELRAIGRTDLGDYLRFEIVRSVRLSVEDALRLKTDVYVGASRWDSFDIDVSCERHFVARVDAVRPAPIVDVDGISALPVFHLYPLVDQIADKVAAMYESHGDGASNRYRDLVDLILLIGLEELDAALLFAALQSREANSRNPVTLPTAMVSPGAAWQRGFAAEAGRSSVPSRLRTLGAAILYVAECLNPVLDGSMRSGSWSPGTRRWSA